MIALYFDTKGKIISSVEVINIEDAFPNEHGIAWLKSPKILYSLDELMLIGDELIHLPTGIKIPTDKIEMGDRTKAKPEIKVEQPITIKEVQSKEIWTNSLQVITSIIFKMEQALQSLEAKDLERVEALQALKLQVDKISIIETDVKAIKTRVDIV